MNVPTFAEEQKLWKQGIKYIAGIDEVGRGPLAGPVVAAAVIIKNTPRDNLAFLQADGKKLIIKDSKKLSPKQREKIFQTLSKSPSVDYGIGIVSEKIIDQINILRASWLAMKKAVEYLKTPPEFILIDGQYTLEDLLINQKAIVNGDTKVFSIAAASIIAKVTRDRLMIEYHKHYPNYGFDAHKGYGTKLHIDALRKYGPCEIHRKSFGPVKKCHKI